ADLAPADRETYTSRRLRALAQTGVAAILSIDNPAAIEPFHWPAAYARSVTIAGAQAPNSNAPILIRINSASLNALFATSGHNPSDIIPNGRKGTSLATLPLNLSPRIRPTSQ